MSSSPGDLVYCLLVDDLEENLITLEALLGRDDVVLLKAKSGQEALEYLLKYDVALALVDVQMPGINGFELAELMRGTERTRRVPIIFLTAGTTNHGRRFQGYEAGAVDFLQKPIEPDVLRSKADVFFELYRQRQEIARLLYASRQQAEALREADRRKDEFLATLAHELRNPLAPVRTGLEILKQTPNCERTVSAAQDMMDRQLAHMVRLIDDLLDISRISRGKIELKREIATARKVIDAAVEASHPYISSGAHEFNVKLTDSALKVYADPTRLSQMISNLLTNAAKYTPRGGQINLLAGTEGDEIIFRVTDTGVGIPPEMLPKVFEMFTQVDRTLDRAQGGLGIGLSLVKRLAELHEGSVVAESMGTGCGSTFTIRLPRLNLREIELFTGTTGSPGKNDEIQLNSRKILVVDDNVDGAQSLAMLLELAGHVTRTAHSGPDGLAAAMEFHPDVMFLDIGLPGMSGYEVAKTVRADSTFGKPVLVALTGWGTDDDRRRSRQAGFDHHLTKPIDSSAIDHILNGAFGDTV